MSSRGGVLEVKDTLSAMYFCVVHESLLPDEVALLVEAGQCRTDRHERWWPVIPRRQMACVTFWLNDTVPCFGWDYEWERRLQEVATARSTSIDAEWYMSTEGVWAT